ncbi:MAG: flotillin-like FloA family protein [Victivallales bacterium]|nr:flotillin-like FloA family protein [Victivallales bacterium]
MTTFFVILGVLIILAALGIVGWLVLFCVNATGLLVEAKAIGCPVGYGDFLRMHFKKLNRRFIVENLKVLVRAGVPVECEMLEDHMQAGGNLTRVVSATVSAIKAGLPLTFQQIAAIDLAGRDVMSAVDSHVKPVVLVCPQPVGKEKPHGIEAVAKDGVKLSVIANITVRTRLDKLVGGAGADTVLARVGEGIVSAIGRAESHRDILADPSIITREILSKKLDENLQYEIVSVDISQLQVGENVNARLRSEQAAADKRIAQAKAAQRHANAKASKQEMLAITMDMKSQVESSQAAIPASMATALGKGQMGSATPVAPIEPFNNKWK